MKKTIVAAAVAAVFAAPVAMADVKISGAVQFEAGEFDDAQTDPTSAANSSDNRVKTDITFSGSEDLGNGLKAGFKITQTADGQTAQRTDEDMYVTLSNGTFNLKAGNFEHYIESSIGAMAANDASHDVSNEISGDESGASVTGQSIELSASPIAGVTVGFQTGDAADTMFAQYSNAGLTVRVASENNDGGDDVLGVAAEYKYDNLTVRYVTIEDRDADDPAWLGASYTMGANTIAVGMIDGGASDGDTTLSLSHALSKSTSVYLVSGTDDSASANDETVVGIKHSF
jgi:hypothetical protein